MIQIHLAVFLWGFTAIFGKLISIDTLGLVFLRMSLAALFYLLLKRTWVGLKKLKRHQVLKLLLIGSLICIHWLCFYQSVKEYNSASIVLICLGTGPMFVIWLEYLLKIKKKLSLQNVLIGLFAIIGMCFLVNSNESNTPNTIGAYEWAITYGVLAAFFAAVFTIMNSKVSNEIEPATISFVEMLSGGICLFIYHSLFNDFDFLWTISQKDLVYTLVLSLVCTNVPFLLSIYSLKKLDAFIVTLSVNLEPIYGLIFAGIIFNEHSNFNLTFYIGASLILVSVFLPIIFGKWKKRKA